MNTGTKVGLGIGLLGLLYAFTRKKFDIVITRTYNTADNKKGIDFKACVYNECLSGTYVMDWVPKVIPFEQNPGFFLVLQGIPAFNEIRVGLGRKDASGAITADYLRVVDFNTAAISGTLSQKEIAEQIISESIPNDLGKSFEEIKKDLLASCNANGYGCSDDIEVKQKGYSLIYTDNANFQGGKKNGGGRGFYAKLRFVGMVKTIKLEDA